MRRCRPRAGGACGPPASTSHNGGNRRRRRRPRCRRPGWSRCAGRGGGSAAARPRGGEAGRALAPGRGGGLGGRGRGGRAVAILETGEGKGRGWPASMLRGYLRAAYCSVSLCRLQRRNSRCLVYLFIVARPCAGRRPQQSKSTSAKRPQSYLWAN